MGLSELVSRYVPPVDAEMRAALQQGPAPHLNLYRYMEYHLGWVDQEFAPLPEEAQRRYGGKRLRPILCLLAYQSAREDWERALPAAAALELIQNFTLIHDDVEDNDPERRHRPTVWKLWGVPQAINAGSCMQSLVITAALRLSGRGVPDRNALETVRILTDCIVELTEGQHLDMSYEDRFDVTLDDYFAMTGRKTGALFEASTHLGALLATEDEGAVSAWRTLGRSFGLAFQARDDYLGVWEQSSTTGKVAGGDILKRKKSLPVAYVLTHGSEEARRTVADTFRQPEIGPADVERVVAVLDRCGAGDYCRQVVREHGERALAALDQVPAGPAVDEVRGLVDLVMTK